MRYKILIVDDEKNMRWALSKALKKEYEVYVAENGLEAIEQYNKVHPDIILLDIRMPKLNGIEVLKRIKETDALIPIIMITAHGDVKSAIEAMRIGALDYISKPFDIDELKIIIEKSLKYKSIRNSYELLIENNKDQNTMIIGKSIKMNQVYDMIQRVANSTATVLICGESGTGKELVAKKIHELSGRRDEAFISVNCGALPEALLESELFGHEKGSFTGAVARKIGRFERAERGSLFLDEIGELSLPMQVKLLRAIQEKEIERIGGNKVLKIDTRIIAATNRNLEKMVEEGKFREDLYYRLKVIPIQLPPLRERKEDIPELVEYFKKKFSENTNKNVKISDITMELLKEYNWPGNIRELQNVIERAVILSWGEYITPEVLAKEILDYKDDFYNDSNVGNEINLPKEGVSLDEVEKSFINQALKRTNGNQTKSAKLLGISRHTLLYRMKKHNIKLDNNE